MGKREIDLSEAEWNLMECLWDSAPRTGREAVDYMRQSVGWSRSTTLTMLRRMTEKGLINCDTRDKVMSYTPLLAREDAAKSETRSFINRIYKGSVSMMVNAITDGQELSKEEIDALYDILRRAEEGRK